MGHDRKPIAALPPIPTHHADFDAARQMMLLTWFEVVARGEANAYEIDSTINAMRAILAVAGSSDGR